MTLGIAESHEERRHTMQAERELARAVARYGADATRGGSAGNGIPRTGDGVPRDPGTGHPVPGRIVITKGNRRLSLVSPAEVRTRRLRFVWHPWLREGLNVLAGYGGSRKSTFAAYMCAQATRGLLTDQDGNRCPPTHILYIGQSEDYVDSVLVPRLNASGCVSELTHILTVSETDESGTETTVSAAARDLKEIKEMCCQIKPGLIVIDPLSLLISGDVNSFQDVQPALVACNELAAVSDGAAVLGLHHWNKNGTFTGSQKFQDTARSFMEIAVAPDDDTASVVSLTKANNSSRPSLRLHAAIVPYECDDGTTTDVQIIDDVSSARLSVDDIRQSRATGDDADDMNDVDAWLAGYLKANRGSAAYRDVMEAGRKEGYSRDQLKRAKKRLHIASVKDGFQGKSCWKMPEEG